MFHNNSSIVLQRLIVISFILISGCSTTQSIITSPTPTFSNFLPPTWTPPITSTPTTTLTPTATKTMTQSLTPSFTSIITQTSAPSLIPLPTIPFDSLTLEFEILLANNRGCRLPCFWGMTPGNTTFAELEQFAHQFPADLVSIEENQVIIYYITSKTGDTTFSVKFFVGNDLIHSINLSVDTARYYVTLPKLFISYGMPTKILIGPPEYEVNPTMLVLYEDQQFMGKYWLYPNPSDNSFYCYDPQFSPIDVITWSPDKTWHNFVNQQHKESYIPIDKVSDYDIQSIQNILKNPNRALCMKIQTDQILP